MIILAALWAWGKTLLPLAFKIPKEVWIGGILVVGVLYYGHYSAKQARIQKDAEYAQKAQKETERQRQVSSEAVRADANRAIEATARLQGLQEDFGNAIERIRKAQGADNMCLDDKFLDSMRSYQQRRRSTGSP